MHIKKRFFTLIEVIVSLTLITIVLTFLFGYFSKITRVEKEVEDLQILVYEKNHLYLRLNNIFSQLRSNTLNENLFYTNYEKNQKNIILNLYFDNGVDPDPNYSEIIKTKLYIDENNNLSLELFSKDKKTKNTRKEILLTNVYKIEYKFLASNNLQMKTYAIEEIIENLSWYNFWPIEKKSLPSIISIKINNNLDFAFFLPVQGAKI